MLQNGVQLECVKQRRAQFGSMINVLAQSGEGAEFALGWKALQVAACTSCRDTINYQILKLTALSVSTGKHFEDNKGNLHIGLQFDYAGNYSAMSQDEIHNAIVKHERSQCHLRSVVQLSCFGSVRIDTQLDQQLKSDVARHNEMVKKNREIMKSLIDTTCFLAMQVLPFRGHGESEDSLNKGNYIECLHLLSSYDTTLREHVESSTTFKGTSTEFKMT
ncbi:hypothetical protein ANN_24734 [Periplaneta americana]|uniref:DUF4371 domain-containing protein n=1 Tax=Periplaneta americana TaxID=6978 RepID=A0ABQ8RZI2_PERAM|nr:hypothetical protein ANN_24734 [Periplaneta americana]